MKRRDLQKLFLVVAMEATDTAHPAHSWALERYAWTRALFADAFQRDIEAGIIRPDVDPVAVASGLIAVLDGLKLQWLLDPDGVDMGSLFEAFADELVASIMVAQGSAQEPQA